jgi:hypothetical protein
MKSSIEIKIAWLILSRKEETKRRLFVLPIKREVEIPDMMMISA